MGELVNENKVEIYMRGGAVCAAEEEIWENTYMVIILVARCVCRRWSEKEEQCRNNGRWQRERRCWMTAGLVARESGADENTKAMPRSCIGRPEARLA